jgi:hypothetical protein
MSDQYGTRRSQQQGWPTQSPQSVQPPPGHTYPPGQPPHYVQPPPGYAYPPPSPPRRKRRRIFMWVFLAIQALFLIWLVVGLATVQTGPTHAQLVAGCYHHNWWPIFKSQADCVTHYGGVLTSAGNVGKGLGAALIVLLWLVVDVILGVSYGVYKLATRGR